MMYNKVSVACN